MCTRAPQAGEGKDGALVLTPPPCRRSSKPTLDCTLLHQSWVFWFCLGACCGEWRLGASLRWWHQHAAREQSLAGWEPRDQCLPSARTSTAPNSCTQGQSRGCPGNCPPPAAPAEREPRQRPDMCPAAVTALWQLTEETPPVSPQSPGHLWPQTLSKTASSRWHQHCPWQQHWRFLAPSGAVGMVLGTPSFPPPNNWPAGTQ